VPARLTIDDAASTQLSITASECSHCDIQENHEKNGNEMVISVSDVCFVTPLVGHTITRKPTDLSLGKRQGKQVLVSSLEKRNKIMQHVTANKSFEIMAEGQCLRKTVETET